MTCTCLPGFVGKGDESCEPYFEEIEEDECLDNDDCGNSEACRNRECVNPCTSRGNPCHHTAQCNPTNHQHECTCLPGFEEDQFGNCIPIRKGECDHDTECPDNRACIQHNCQDPCLIDEPCGIEAICEVISHRAICKCPPGWGGQPFEECYQYECTQDRDCPRSKACVNNECVDPCLNKICGRGADCKVDFHQAFCVCPQGLQGNPDNYCVEVGCRTDNECASNEKCDYINPADSKRECVRLCVRNPCALGASCTAENHRETCKCDFPLVGDGYTSCIEERPDVEEVECQLDSDCQRQPEVACINNECQDPCRTMNPCQPDQECVVSSRARYGGSVSVSCNCPSGSVVGPQGQCKVVDVRPECYDNNDCRATEICNQGSCVDACRIKGCGINARCQHTLHDARCDCLQGYTGNPNVECRPRKFRILKNFYTFLSSLKYTLSRANSAKKRVWSFRYI